MTRAQRKTLTDYIRLLADEMRLRDWTVELGEEPCDAGRCASVHLVYGRKLATISVPNDVSGTDAEELRHTLVHELIHVHFEPATNAVLNDLQTLIGRPADMVFWEGFKRQYEYGTDGLADAISRHFPLIDWGKT
jgi:hypothetical protein